MVWIDYVTGFLSAPCELVAKLLSCCSYPKGCFSGVDQVHLDDLFLDDQPLSTANGVPNTGHRKLTPTSEFVNKIIDLSHAYHKGDDYESRYMYSLMNDDVKDLGKTFLEDDAKLSQLVKDIGRETFLPVHMIKSLKKKWLSNHDWKSYINSVHGQLEDNVTKSSEILKNGLKDWKIGPVSDGEIQEMVERITKIGKDYWAKELAEFGLKDTYLEGTLKQRS